MKILTVILQLDGGLFSFIFFTMSQLFYNKNILLFKLEK